MLAGAMGGHPGPYVQYKLMLPEQIFTSFFMASRKGMRSCQPGPSPQTFHESALLPRFLLHTEQISPRTAGSRWGVQKGSQEAFPGVLSGCKCTLVPLWEMPGVRNTGYE